MKMGEIPTHIFVTDITADKGIRRVDPVSESYGPQNHNHNVQAPYQSPQEQNLYTSTIPSTSTIKSPLESFLGRSLDIQA